MIKYNLYEGSLDTLPIGARFTHYENGRTLIYFQRKPNNSGWHRLTHAEINKLTEHEKKWFIECRAKMATERLLKPDVQSELIKRCDRMLDLYEQNLKEITEKDGKDAEEREGDG